eukprot:TRINITY_DN1333_c0_g1_i4.p1 TRINITY_DN1333_c0_g1~~TRINITY_DN1333_c0_g1_i4.p1  ORF type:complete len:220 (-),score=59.01 TRINITY_DN1333_c0_g1_i4:71-730(-)
MSGEKETKKEENETQTTLTENEEHKEIEQKDLATLADKSDNTTYTEATTSNTNITEDEQDLDELKQKVQQMQEEAARLEQIQQEVESQMGGSQTAQQAKTVDRRSVYVGNVDYGATPEELQLHFGGCGVINRITILCDKLTGHPKGYAYIEFADDQGVMNACTLNDTIFRSRQLKVNPKRTNVPGCASSSFRGYKGNSRRAMYYHPYAPYQYGMYGQYQ